MWNQTSPRGDLTGMFAGSKQPLWVRFLFFSEQSSWVPLFPLSSFIREPICTLRSPSLSPIAVQGLRSGCEYAATPSFTHIPCPPPFPKPPSTMGTMGGREGEVYKVVKKLGASCPPPRMTVKTTICSVVLVVLFFHFFCAPLHPSLFFSD